MSASPPPALEGTHAPSPFEVLWERYRSLILVVVAAIFVALIGNYGLKYYEQRGIDQKWSAFAASLGIDEIYVDQTKAIQTLAESLKDIELASLEASLATADAGQKPYYLLAIARKAMLEGDWDRATRALDDLESGYPEHTLVKRTEIPVQSREQEELPDDATPAQRQNPEWKPAKEGSVVSLMREQIEAAKGFALPESFARPEIPADARRVRFTLGDRGSFVIALMPQAPKHAEAFLELASAEEPYWVGVAVDEIQRPTDTFDRPRALHLGYASTRSDDSTKWTTTEPSEHLVEFEDSKLSHFPGAVAGRPEADGMSCANRLWICVDDAAPQDGTRVVFGYVVEGLDVLEGVCEATMSAAEEERGQGRPAEPIRVTAVEVL